MFESVGAFVTFYFIAGATTTALILYGTSPKITSALATIALGSIFITAPSLAVFVGILGGGIGHAMGRLYGTALHQIVKE